MRTHIRRVDEYRVTTNPRVYRMYRRYYTLGCDHCPPHRKENWRRNHPARSWKGYRGAQYK